MTEQYERMFGSKPKESTSPLEIGNHPESDTSEALNPDYIEVYQSMICSLLWPISLGRFGILTATMTNSQFCSAPRNGHIKRVKWMYRYLQKLKNASIRVRTEEPDFTATSIQAYDWSEIVFVKIQEAIATDLPKPFCSPVILVCYVVARFKHDTVAFGLEFVAARIAVYQSVDLRCIHFAVLRTSCKRYDLHVLG
jgi:hypothetical protein